MSAEISKADDVVGEPHDYIIGLAVGGAVLFSLLGVKDSYDANAMYSAAHDRAKSAEMFQSMAGEYYSEPYVATSNAVRRGDMQSRIRMEDGLQFASTARMNSSLAETFDAEGNIQQDTANDEFGSGLIMVNGALLFMSMRRKAVEGKML